MEEAGWLASRGYYEEAALLLLHVAGRDPVAALLLASVYKEQGRWKECDQYCRTALVLLEKLRRTEEVIPLWVQAYDNRAAVALEQKRYDEARLIYEEAMRRVSPARAYFHFRLGRLHHTAGRPGTALHHLQEAVNIDPEGMTERVRPVMEDIRLHTPGCLLRWWGP